MCRFWLYFHFFVVLILGVVSCSSPSNEAKQSSNDTTIIVEKVDSNLLKQGVLVKLDYAIQNLKSSDEFIKILSQQTDLYDETVLNPFQKSKQYESSMAKALNLGIYGADLNYIIHFNQIPVSFKYLICAKQLADQIGISMAFNKKVVEKFNGNVDQKDTLINIVNSAYNIIKTDLRNGEQFQIASLVMAGSWIENMHLTLYHLPKIKNEKNKIKITTELNNQKEYLQNLCTLLTVLDTHNDSRLREIYESLQSIQKCFLSEDTLNQDRLTRNVLVQKIDKVRSSMITFQ